ncbi:MAG: hypothetical protein FJW23_07425 [Acidimicrobiia bacterium]|nr:hypothetical protein [Acidimicrobiia bacterium]
MRRTIGALLALAVCLALGQGTTYSQSAGPPLGTWKFNAAKSKMNLSLPPRNLTRTYEDRGGGVYIYTQQGNGPDGKSVFSMYVARDDGKEYPMFVRGRNEMGTISIKPTDAYTAEQIEKVGTATTTAKRELSRDGKTLTITVYPAASAARMAGTVVKETNLMVFDRQ